MDKYYKSGEKVKGGYIISQEIGEGRYGIAYLAENDNNEKVVVKQLKKKMLKETRKSLIYEQKILRSLNNPAFPKFIDKFKERNREGYILEYFEGKDFEELVSNNRCRFTKDDIYHIAGQLLDLIEVLHNRNIVHRDIRLPNVILKKDRKIALIDFGMARFIDNKNYKAKEDYWYLGDFLIHLYYTGYEEDTNDEDKPWYEELDLTKEEESFLKKLMGIEKEYRSINEIREQLEKIKKLINK
ncbi:protein kinase family protein [uncultured Clostridium sp.]|uniref:protein kinase family protein n=1 Tax=uncultured Clostridium sp. TaxID=59620 RepID=UPI0025EC6077|nr:protein kinase family protein [uncultured Clostridium sp.]